jgi:hypothetical protein
MKPVEKLLANQGKYEERVVKSNANGISALKCSDYHKATPDKVADLHAIHVSKSKL